MLCEHVLLYLQLVLQLVAMSSPSVAAVSTIDGSASCRDRFGVVDVVSFRQRSCTLCFYYLFPGVGGLMPSKDNYTRLERLNGSDVYVVDSEEPASLDRVCHLLAGDMGGADGCSRWVGCCAEADACCRRQRRSSPTTTAGAVASGSCEATWDGFSCWDRTPAGTVVYQQCPVYMERSDVSGSFNHVVSV